MANLAALLEERSIPEPNSGCRLWLGSMFNCGYGRIKISGRTHAAHRASYELHCGPIPRGMFVCHKCDVRACINPEHLWLGTHLDNVADMVAKGRQPRNKGTRAGGVKLTDELVLAIRADSRTQKAVASDYGITRSQVSHIRSRKCWSHI